MPPTRTRVDACPGVVSPHLAADGALARVRLPGGAVTAPALRAVADLAADAGDGAVHLTSRGNLQLRGLDPADPRPVERLGAAGLLPSRTHERVRNVLASPLSGIRGGVADVRGRASALDRGLCARPALAALPGRFLFALDDGRGDVAAERPDVCWVAGSVDDGELLVAGVPTGLRCSPATAPGLLLDAAEAFLTLRAAHAGDPDARAWRAAELPDAAARVADTLTDVLADRPDRRPLSDGTGRTAGTRETGTTGRVPHPGGHDRRTVSADPGSAGRAARPGARHGPDVTVDPPAHGPVVAMAVTGTAGTSVEVQPVVGRVGAGAVAAAPVLGELSAGQLHVLADLAPDLLVTPWRTLVLPTPHDPGAALDALRAAGLVVDPDHPALHVSACAGTPGCAKSRADVRTHARSLIADGQDRPVHVSGCDRRCGAPHGRHTDLIATGPRTYTTEELP